MPNITSRRTFLKQAALTVGTAQALDAAFLFAGEPPSAKLRTAVIGCGGRGEVSLDGALGENLVAIVDIDDKRLAAAAKKAAARGAQPKTFSDYRRMFDTMHKEIDAVFVATPDHHHAPASMLAIQRGKHVYCEKPLCHDVFEARSLARAAQRHNVTTMIGNQGHCEEGYRLLCEYIWSGAIGDVLETHSWSGFVNGGAGPRPAAKPVPAGLHWDEWLGPAPYREYHEGLHPLYWRYYRDFGTGGLGDWGCHNLDGVFWALSPGHPASIECLGSVGGNGEKNPQASVIRWNIPARGLMPAMKVHWYDGSKLEIKGEPEGRAGQISLPNYPPMLAEFEKKYDCNFREGYDGGTFYIGTKGVMHTGCYGHRPLILPGSAHKAFPVPQKRIARIKGTPIAHFLQCCKEEKPTCANFEYAAAITEFLLLGNLAAYAGAGTKVEWNGAKGRCTNLPEVNQYLRRTYRKGWKI